DLCPAVCRHDQNLSGHSNAATRYPSSSAQIPSNTTFPSIAIRSLLQLVAAAHVSDRDQVESHRYRHE
ncbi:MAG: hypothetical protein WAJ92_10050, partial [Candidatus Acidiferrales bacterium]